VINILTYQAILIGTGLFVSNHGLSRGSIHVLLALTTWLACKRCTMHPSSLDRTADRRRSTAPAQLITAMTVSPPHLCGSLIPRRYQWLRKEWFTRGIWAAYRSFRAPDERGLSTGDALCMDQREAGVNLIDRRSGDSENACLDDERCPSHVGLTFWTDYV
jgi:hypothetical protein